MPKTNKTVEWSSKQKPEDQNMQMLHQQNVRKLIGNYEKLREIGRGTYGCVYEGRHVTSKQRVAIKKVYATNAVGDKEAELLQLCQQCDHVVKLLEVVRQRRKVYLILEFMMYDLQFFLPKDLPGQQDDDVQLALMSIGTSCCPTDATPPPKPPKLTQDQQQQQPVQCFDLKMEHVKFFLGQLLEAVAQIHAQNIIHRDLKPNNLLFNDQTKQAKLTDFGMARKLLGPQNGLPSSEKLSIQVVTRAYRAPELFFGKEEYGKEIDMWSVGCVFAEMVLRKPLFDGASDIDHLSQIFTILGSPNENGWHEASSLPFFLRFKDTHPRPLAELFGPEEQVVSSPSTTSSPTSTPCLIVHGQGSCEPTPPPRLPLSDIGIDLLSQMLQIVPEKRITAKDALAHEFFQELPYANPPPMQPKSKVLKKRTIAQQQRPSLDEDQEAFGDCSFAIKGRRIA